MFGLTLKKIKKHYQISVYVVECCANIKTKLEKQEIYFSWKCWHVVSMAFDSLE